MSPVNSARIPPIRPVKPTKPIRLNTPSPNPLEDGEAPGKLPVPDGYVSRKDRRLAEGSREIPEVGKDAEKVETFETKDEADTSAVMIEAPVAISVESTREIVQKPSARIVGDIHSDAVKTPDKNIFADDNDFSLSHDSEVPESSFVPSVEFETTGKVEVVSKPQRRISKRQVSVKGSSFSSAEQDEILNPLGIPGYISPYDNVALKARGKKLVNAVFMEKNLNNIYNFAEINTDELDEYLDKIIADLM